MIPEFLRRLVGADCDARQHEQLEQSRDRVSKDLSEKLQTALEASREAAAHNLRIQCLLEDAIKDARNVSQ